ncbi:UvrD-helicase domain-containing protein [Roseateles sp. DAIF2]|uniref:UvrD-helicase domain-containing protein n=1 Tax=Roseateles sp. DAIF2 TaxID=2714952 RepID=UPI0018A3167F|nr:UvrD-helicase domain-containing protein [Roseateles sp. DAIF2]QPF72689.1 UvrD-helicase domain-containing protein [Roseateles sp. DAIF2]
MTIPAITEEDLAELKSLTKDLDFSDAERRAVLLAADSSDINAAPGSGKTSVLVAKLLLLSRKWRHDKRGICVLSHTNVAREEIQRRLGATPDGSRLLAHPHFIGTIHAFVDRFLALPALRSEGRAVDVIDDDVFERRALSLALRHKPVWGWTQHKANAKDIIGGLIYRGPNLDLTSENGDVPKTGACRPILEAVKAQLTAEGVFRYADMFTFAEKLLAKLPGIKDQLSRRFPLVYIDEMQDTSWDQEALLAKLFNDSVVVQRFGDVNQRILVGNGDFAKLSFPSAKALPISTSKRFGPKIAESVSGVRIGGPAVIGTAADVHPPMLVMYTTERVGHVLNYFGTRVIDLFSEEAVHQRPVKALCARKQSEAKQSPGRTLLDYWPSYSDTPRGGRAASLWALLNQVEKPWVNGIPMHDRAMDAKRAVLLVLRAAKVPHIDGLRDASQLLRRLTDANLDVMPVRHLVRELALKQGLGATVAGRLQAVQLFHDYLAPLLPKGLSAAKFASLPVFAAPVIAPEQEVSHRLCRVEHKGRFIEVEIGTVASMKGETHLATLVLESVAHRGNQFDLAQALPVLANLNPRDPRMTDTGLSQFRNLYVAMSRPTSLLCLAVNKARVTADCVAALQKNGWAVEELS